MMCYVCFIRYIKRSELSFLCIGFGTDLHRKSGSFCLGDCDMPWEGLGSDLCNVIYKWKLFKIHNIIKDNIIFICNNVWFEPNFFFSKIIAYKLTCPVRNEGCPIRLFTSTTVYQDCSKGFIFSCLTSHLFIIFIVNKHENGCLDLKTDQQFHFRFVLSAWGLKTALRMGQWKMSGSRLLRPDLPCFVKQARLLAIFSFR